MHLGEQPLAEGAYLYGASPGFTLAEHYNGTKWAIVSTPNPPGSDFAALASVTCTSASNCWAAGEAIGGSEAVSGTLIEHYSNGSCAMTFTPSSATMQTITAKYGGDADHVASQGSTALRVT